MRCEPASASSTWRPMRSRSRATSVSCFCLSFASGPRSAKSHSSRGSSVAFHAWRGMGVRRLRSERGGESKESKLRASSKLDTRVGATRVGAPWMKLALPERRVCPWSEAVPGYRDMAMERRRGGGNPREGVSRARSRPPRARSPRLRASPLPRAADAYEAFQARARPADSKCGPGRESCFRAANSQQNVVTQRLLTRVSAPARMTRHPAAAPFPHHASRGRQRARSRRRVAS